jgi:hypothetical protein
MVKKIFLLWHIHEYPDKSGLSHVLLGAYSTVESAKKRIKNSLNVVGFRDFPNGFKITEHVLDYDGWPDKYVSLQRDFENKS